MFVLAAIILAGAMVAFVASPLVQGLSAPLTDGPDRLSELRELYNLRDVTYEILRDLELDFHAGKINEQDYLDLSDRYKTDAAGLLVRIDALEAMIPVPGKKGLPGK
jgi:hypothetical protein